ncbi:MAG TPA: hypothetical protein DCY41_03910 [Opitutae bacterium]|nr:hypothetical protein [Opitutae bacterium]
MYPLPACVYRIGKFNLASMTSSQVRPDFGKETIDPKSSDLILFKNITLNKLTSGIAVQDF